MTLMLKQKNQSGMASFLVVSIIVTLLALISIGFSHLADREERQSLDRELSDQAYYAAESGMNDAKNYIVANPTASTSNCTLPNSNNFVSNGDISNGQGVAKYTCIVMQASPKEMVFDVYPDRPISIEASLAGIKSFYFSWQNKTYTGTPKPLGTFPTLPKEGGLDPNATGLLRVGIYPARAGDNASTLASASKQFFMYPNSGNGTVGTLAFSSGGFAQGKCKANATPSFCNSQITSLPSSGNFYISMSANYAPLTVIVRAANSAGTIVGVPGVEGSIDVTGSGSDVLRRIQSYVPLNLNSSIPGYGLQSMQAICKLFRVSVSQPNQYSGSYLDSSATNPDNACFSVSGNSNDTIDNSGSPPPL